MQSGLFAAIARHGAYHQPRDVPSAHLPHGLTANGRTQARELADHLLAMADAQKAEVHAQVHASSLLRAHQTAWLAAQRMQQRRGEHFIVSDHDALAERSLGAAANLQLRQIEDALASDPRYSRPKPGWKRDSDYRLPFIGAESLLDAGRRTAKHIVDTLEQLERPESSRKVLLFVGHGGALRHAAAELGVLGRSRLSELSMHHARPILLAYEGSRAFTHVAGEWKVRVPDADLD